MALCESAWNLFPNQCKLTRRFAQSWIQLIFLAIVVVKTSQLLLGNHRRTICQSTPVNGTPIRLIQKTYKKETIEADRLSLSRPFVMMAATCHLFLSSENKIHHVPVFRYKLQGT